MADEGGLQYSIADSESAESDATGINRVVAPIAPGIVPSIPISSWHRMPEGERLKIERRHCTVALDGERAFSVNESQLLEMEVLREGPPVIDVSLALTVAARQGLFSLTQGT